MGQVSTQLLDSWHDGVVTSMEPDAIPPSAYSRGYNAALTSIGGGKAVVMKRLGLGTLNRIQLTGASAVVGIHEFKQFSGGGFTAHRLLVSDNGRLDVLNTDGTTSVVDATAFTASATQEHLPSFADANNCCFIVNGTDAVKYDGTDLTNFGIAAPLTAPTLADAGSAGLHDGTYEARVTYANSLTGAESSAGPTSGTVTLVTNQIAWTNVPVSPDAQVDTRYLYIRNTTTQSNFYYVGTIANNSGTTATTNVADGSLTEVGPDEFENGPAPDGALYLAWHHARMFAATTANLHYSQLPDLDGIPHPEAFDAEAFEPINPDDGQKITGIISVFDLVVVFKSDSMYALVGDDPDTWSIRLIDATVGCLAHRSIIIAEGKLYWWSEHGPMVWDGSGAPTAVGSPFISNTISPEVLATSPSVVNKICAADDIIAQRIIFAVPELSVTRNTRMLPFSYELSRWESDKWDPMDVASLGRFEDSNGLPYVTLGGYAGQVFQLGSAANDGVATGTLQGTFVAAGSSVTTVTDGTATFDTTGGGLIERKVTIVNSAGEAVDTARPRITSNNGTSFTMAAAVNNLTAAETYTYYIGGPAFDWYSPWLTQESAFMKKRYMFLYMQLRPTNTVSDMLVDTYVNYNLNPTTARTQTFTTDAGSGTWDVSLWDVGLWDSSLAEQQRFRIGRTGVALLVRMRHYAPDTEFDFLKLGIISEMLSERLG